MYISYSVDVCLVHFSDSSSEATFYLISSTRCQNLATHCKGCLKLMISRTMIVHGSTLTTRKYLDVFIRVVLVTDKPRN